MKSVVVEGTYTTQRSQACVVTTRLSVQREFLWTRGGVWKCYTLAFDRPLHDLHSLQVFRYMQFSTVDSEYILDNKGI